MVTRKQERALRDEIESLKHDISSLYHYRDDRKRALDVLKQYADEMPEGFAKKERLLLEISELMDIFPPEEPTPEN